MSRLYVKTIFDLLIYPTERLYDVKDVDLIFHTKIGEVRKPLLIEGRPQYDEEFLDKWIKSNRLEYEEKPKIRGDEENNS
jgi:hypothetical protein